MTTTTRMACPGLWVSELSSQWKNEHAQLKYRKTSVWASLPWKKKGSKALIGAAHAAEHGKLTPSSRTGRVWLR